jgi:hypothetical protein
MVLRFACSFDELGDNVRRRRQVGVTHAEVDDIFAPVTRLHFHTVDDAEDVGREPFDPLKFHGICLTFSQRNILNYFYKRW